MENNFSLENCSEHDVWLLGISLEFCPDEPEVEKKLTATLSESSQAESPLDDIRQMINKVQP